MSRDRKETDRVWRNNVVTPGQLSPVMQLSLLEDLWPQIAPTLRELRDQWIQQFELQTAPELLILDQTLVAYAYAVLLGQEAGNTIRRRTQATDGVPSAAPADGPAGRPARGGITRKAERELRLLVRLNRMFLRNLNVMKRWKTQDIGTVMMESVLDKLRK